MINNATGEGIYWGQYFEIDRDFNGRIIWQERGHEWQLKYNDDGYWNFIDLTGVYAPLIQDPGLPDADTFNLVLAAENWLYIKPGFPPQGFQCTDGVCPTDGMFFLFYSSKKISIKIVPLNRRGLN